MLGRRGDFFQSFRSLECVCYRASEIRDESLQRLLRELPGAGVSLVELDACMDTFARAYSGGDPGAAFCQALKKALPVSATLLLAGTPETLALAAGTPMATVGYGALAAEGAGCDLLEEAKGPDCDVPEEAKGPGCDLLEEAERPGCDVPEEAKGPDCDVPEEAERPGCDVLEEAGSGVTCGPLRADILVEGFEEVDVQFLDRIMKRAQKLPWITVVTDRCILREITLEDLDDLFELYSQPGITDYTEPLYERQEEEQYTKDYIANMYRFYGYGMWLVFARESGALIGRAGFSHQDLGGEIVLEMGYIIGVPYQRQGYATEVCEKLIAFARTNLSDFGTLNCFVESGNAASHGLLKKLGFEETGSVKISGKPMVRYQKKL